jgi:16S rRNA (uracil1498-N3)-methyltransferase
LNLFYQPGIPDGIHFLDAHESRHAVCVLRMLESDRIELTDGQGFFYSAKILKVDSKKCEFEILNEKFIPKRNFQTHIAIAPTKNADRTEWFVEKATEIGIDAITFLQCKNSERKTVNIDRVEKIAISAMKQSQQAWLPKINTMTSFKEILTAEAHQKFIAYVDASNPKHLQSLVLKGKNYLVLIGPEGDFSKEELDLAIQHGYEKISLGTNRLRTETAGLAACQALYFINS